jgi:ABC-type transporter Mla MlaB component
VDWTSLSTLDAAASAELVACFTQSQGAPSQLVFVDTPNLLYVLAQATPQGQPQVARSLWELRFCLLSLMQMRAAFDAAATDFCLTYLESAPVWKTSAIRFVGDALVPGKAPSAVPKNTPWQLSGHVLGATGLGLAELAERSTQPASARIAIDCSALVRMDADAIAQLQRWLQSARLVQADVHLQDVGVLVGAAWASAGIEALAQVHLR